MSDLILPMLVVDKNIEVSLREQAEWKKHGIDTVQVNTMQEAIEKLTKESFLFTAINAGWHKLFAAFKSDAGYRANIYFCYYLKLYDGKRSGGAS